MKKTIAAMLAVMMVLAVPFTAHAKTVYSNVISISKEADKAAKAAEKKAEEEAAALPMIAEEPAVEDAEDAVSGEETVSDAEQAGNVEAALDAEPVETEIVIDGKTAEAETVTETEQTETADAVITETEETETADAAVIVIEETETIDAVITETEETETTDAVITEIEEMNTFDAVVIETEADTLDGEAAETEVGEEIIYEGFVLDGGENGAAVYAAADAESEILILLNTGETFDVLSYDEVWAHIRAGEIKGYIQTAKIALENVEGTDGKIRSVTVVNDLTEVVIQPGTIVTFSAILTGFENDTYTAQWYEKPYGGEYAPMEGEMGLSVSFPVTADNFYNEWRIVITLTGTIAE